MESKLEDILKETESKFSYINNKIDNLIIDEQSVINSFKIKIKKAITAFLIVSLIGYSSYKACKFKKKQDILFGNSMYYQAVKDERLEEVAKRVCFDNYDLDQIIEFNKGFNVWFDSKIDNYETVHFPKKYVKNKELLKNFENEKTVLKEKILNNKNFVDIFFKSDLSEENIKRVYQILDEIDYDSKKIQELTYDNYFKDEALPMLTNLNSLESYIKGTIERKIGNLNAEFKQDYNSFRVNDWMKPGALEKLENLLSKNNCIKSFYSYFGNDFGVNETKKLEKEIIQKKNKYVAFTDEIIEDINKNKKIILQIDDKLGGIFDFGINDRDIELLNAITEKSKTIPSYDLWKNEKIMRGEMSIYLIEFNKLTDNIDKKFSFAVKTISNDINKFSEENIVPSTFGKNLTKEKVRNVYHVLDELKHNKSKYLMLKNDSYFEENPNNLILKIENLEDEINDSINYGIKKAGFELSKLENELYNESWKSAGTLEKLKTLDLKRNEIRNVYYCFSDTSKVVEIDDIGNYVIEKKNSYLKILNKISEDIEKNTIWVENLQNRVEPLLKNGLQNNELPIISEIKEKINIIPAYSKWKGEKKLENQLREYSSKRNNLNYKVNQKFNYALSLLNKEVGKLEKEISDAKKMGRIESGALRLEYILENPLVLIRYRYYLLGYKNGINRTNTLINKVKSYI